MVQSIKSINQNYISITGTSQTTNMSPHFSRVLLFVQDKEDPCPPKIHPPPHSPPPHTHTSCWVLSSPTPTKYEDISNQLFLTPGDNYGRSWHRDLWFSHVVIVASSLKCHHYFFMVNARSDRRTLTHDEKCCNNFNTIRYITRKHTFKKNVITV